MIAPVRLRGWVGIDPLDALSARQRFLLGIATTALVTTALVYPITPRHSAW